MLQDVLWQRSGIEYSTKLVVLDADCLWQKSGIEERVTQAGFNCYSANDSISLRYIYEKHIIIDHEMCVILYNGSFVPYDIEKNCTVFDASISQVYQLLDAETLRSFRNMNYDLLSVAYHDVFVALGRDDTEDFCCGRMWQAQYLRDLCAEYYSECNALIQRSTDRNTWLRVADRLGFILLACRMGVDVEGFDDWYADISARFMDWMKSDYKYLSGTPTKRQPYLMNHVQDFIRRNNNGKVALIVMDGMSYADYHLIRRDLARNDCDMSNTSLFSFVPSITSVARQSLFSGKLPAEHPKPFDLSNEEKQFREYWESNGFKATEVAFIKSESPEWLHSTKVLGIVINIVDDLMHSELQGNKGMYTSLATWLDNGNLSALINRLARDGFTIYMTADHGNTSAVAQGRFVKPSIIMENASRRAAIYQAFAGAEELDKFSVTEYTGPYMPKDYRYFAFDPHACYGNKGTEYISHGGMTIEEMIVPFVQIGAHNG